MMRIYEVTVPSLLEIRVYQACSILEGKVILSTLESDRCFRIFCAAQSSFPDVLDSLGGAIEMKDLTDKLLDDRLP